MMIFIKSSGKIDPSLLEIIICQVDELMRAIYGSEAYIYKKRGMHWLPN